MLTDDSPSRAKKFKSIKRYVCISFPTHSYYPIKRERKKERKKERKRGFFTDVVLPTYQVYSLER